MTALATATQITDRSDLATATSIDRVIRASTAVAVLAVAGVAAYVSYWHAYAVVRAHGGSGVTARLEPATIDGLVYASSMFSGGPQAVVRRRAGALCGELLQHICQCGARCCRCSEAWPVRTYHMHDNPAGRRRVDATPVTCTIRTYVRFIPVFTL